MSIILFQIIFLYIFIVVYYKVFAVGIFPHQVADLLDEGRKLQFHL